MTPNSFWVKALHALPYVLFLLRKCHVSPQRFLFQCGKTIYYGTEREISVGKHGIFLVKTGHKVTRVML